MISDAFWKNPQYLIEVDPSYFDDISEGSNLDDDHDDYDDDEEEEEDDDSSFAFLYIALMQKPCSNTNPSQPENEEILQIDYTVFEVVAVRWLSSLQS